MPPEQELWHDKDYAKDVMSAFVNLGQRLKKAFWTALPSWRREQLQRWQMG